MTRVGAARHRQAIVITLLIVGAPQRVGVDVRDAHRPERAAAVRRQRRAAQHRSARATGEDLGRDPDLERGATVAAAIASARATLDPCEVIVVDAGSADGTRRSRRRPARGCEIAAGSRAVAMNAGARLAQGDALLFLHADTTLPDGAGAAVRAALPNRGRRRLPPPLRRARPVLQLGDLPPRARLPADLRRPGDLRHAGGVRPDRRLPPMLEIMEDYDLVQRLRRHGPLHRARPRACAPPRGVTTAGHRPTVVARVGDPVPLPRRGVTGPAGAHVSAGAVRRRGVEPSAGSSAPSAAPAPGRRCRAATRRRRARRCRARALRGGRRATPRGSGRASPGGTSGVDHGMSRNGAACWRAIAISQYPPSGVGPSATSAPAASAAAAAVISPGGRPGVSEETTATGAGAVAGAKAWNSASAKPAPSCSTISHRRDERPQRPARRRPRHQQPHRRRLAPRARRACRAAAPRAAAPRPPATASAGAASSSAPARAPWWQSGCASRECSAEGMREAIAAGTIGSRLWFYTNYHCNLACSYCLTGSSPHVAAPAARPGPDPAHRGRTRRRSASTRSASPAASRCWCPACRSWSSGWPTSRPSPC